MTTKSLRSYSRWEDFLTALRDGVVPHEDGAYRRVVYDSPYSDDPQVLEGEIENTSSTVSFGKPFTLEGKRIRGFTVESSGREIGRVTEMAVEIDRDATTDTEGGA